MEVFNHLSRAEQTNLNLSYKHVYNCSQRGKFISVEEQLRLIRLQKDFDTSQKEALARLKRNS